MGSKPRKQPINVHIYGTKIYASHPFPTPAGGRLVAPTDRELFVELAIRGYDLSSNYNGPRKRMVYFNFVTFSDVPKTKFFIHVPEGKYPLEES